MKEDLKKIETEIDDILSRSISAVYPSKEDLKKVLLSGKKLKIYIGADATGPNLHIGHATNFILIEKLRKLGHKVIILFGDFTAMIGDPTDKGAARVALSSSEVEKNILSWKKQISPLIPLGGFRNPPKVVKNSKWLSKLSFKDVVGLSSNFTVQQMIERDMFQKRLKEEKPIYLNEFLYPLMQGYDSVALDVDVEIGGSDQTFNMLAGRTLQRKFRNKEKFVITTTLLEDPRSGKKLMNKSEGNVIGLLDSPEDMFGKVMALPDEVIVSVLTDCTYATSEKINEIKKDISEGNNPKDAKMFLGEELVNVYYGRAKAEKAKAAFIKTFSEKGVPEDIQVLVASKDKNISDVLVEASIVSSKSDFGRLVKEGAISNAETGEKITDIFAKVQEGGVFKVGKHRFVKIKIQA